MKSGVKPHIIGIRTDANDVVATGHMMRCMTIAKQLEKLGTKVIFFVADGYGIPMLQENGFAYEVLHTDWANLMEEIEILCQGIQLNNVRTMLFDSYRMTKQYFEELRERLADTVRFAYIDDLFEDVYPVDIIINYNAYYEQFPYDEAYSDKTCTCLGAKYVPLREEFAKEDLADGCENSVLLSCGGGDALQSLHGILERAVREERFAKTKFQVVVGRYHQKKELLDKLAGEYDNIILHHNVSNMSELMETCQVAVSAAGTMLYELCAMERSTVFFITADNQRYDSDFFAEDERMVFAGDIRENREQCICRILDGVHALLSDNDKRMVMKEKLRQVTDGKGAERIAKVLLEQC